MTMDLKKIISQNKCDGGGIKKSLQKSHNFFLFGGEEESYREN